MGCLHRINILVVVKSLCAWGIKEMGQSMYVYVRCLQIYLKYTLKVDLQIGWWEYRFMRGGGRHKGVEIFPGGVYAGCAQADTACVPWICTQKVRLQIWVVEAG